MSYGVVATGLLPQHLVQHLIGCLSLRLLEIVAVIGVFDEDVGGGISFDAAYIIDAVIDALPLEIAVVKGGIDVDFSR